MRNNSLAPTRCLAAFTLIELLVVVAIIIIAAGFATPALQSIARGSSVERSGDLLLSNLVLARQSAMARNRPIEVRLYNYQGPEDTSAAFRAIQLYEVLPDATYKPITKPIRLPQRIIISQSATLSTWINELEGSSNYELPETPSIPALGSYTGVAFRFRPDGGTDLPRPSATDPPYLHLTLHDENDPLEGGRPVNFFTLQIDSLNGSLRSFRP